MRQALVGARRLDWRGVRDRSARLAAALRALGVGRGSTLNTRLDAALIAWQMNHCEAQVVKASIALAPSTG